MSVLGGRTILVTGAGGFIGRHAVRRLRDEGAAVVAWVRRAADPIPGVNYEVVDLARWDDVGSRLTNRRFTAIVHLASRGRSMKHLRDVAEDLALTVNLIEASRSAQIGRLVFFGSADQYGASDPPQSVSTPTRPLTPYGLAKDLADAVLGLSSRQFGLAVVIFRPFSVYGEGQPATMFVAQAIRACLRGGDLRLAPGSQVRDFIYVEDVCDALVQTLAADGLTGIFNLGTGQGTRIVDVAQQIVALTDADIQILSTDQLGRDDPMALVADIHETIERLRWLPKTSLRSGLQRVIAYEQAIASA